MSIWRQRTTDIYQLIIKNISDVKRRTVIKNLSVIPLGGSLLSIDSILKDPFHSGYFNPGETASGLNADGALEIGPDIFRSIGVEPLILCLGTFTAIGGSIELPEVRKAMEYAAPFYVQLDELAMAVDKRLSELTGAE